MSKTKCSLEHLKQYQNGINEYLMTQNITDFTKYQVHIKDNELFYDKWDYSAPKPSNVKEKTLHPLFVPVETRLIYMNIKANFSVIYINARGEVFRNNTDGAINDLTPLNPVSFIRFNKCTEKIETILKTEYLELELNKPAVWKWKNMVANVKDGIIEYVYPVKEKIRMTITVSRENHNEHSLSSNYYTIKIN